ncbi:MAG TPA: hypothetical protein VFG00_15165 [Acidothermaceae bacterium]|nr:hypothetical protein [Acidothermaceae bacterium]
MRMRSSADSSRTATVLAATGLALSVLMLTSCSSGKRAHGLPTFPDPAVATDGPAAGHAILDKSVLKNYSDGVVNQAITACRSALDQAGLVSGQGSSNISQQELQARLALARCIRAHGVPNFPDPNPTTGDVTAPPGLSKNSPSILAAIHACPSQAQAAGLSPGES